MLSRVAERLYWMARYMERAENTARLVNVYSNLLLDLPAGASVGWDTLIKITGDDGLFSEVSEVADEKSVTRYLLTHKLNPGSILNSISMARENARTTREIIPAEAWELINSLYLYVKENTRKSSSRRGRLTFSRHVISHAQQLTGMLSGCMSHNYGYDFMVMGRNLERADMTSRIIDVGAATLLKPETDGVDVVLYENSLWMNVLRSLNAYQMYRQHVRDRVNGKDVVEFLLLDREFPRTILHCLSRIEDAVKSLPHNEDCLRSVARALRRVREVKIDELLLDDALYEFVDQLQLEFSAIHHTIDEVWFSMMREQTRAAS